MPKSTTVLTQKKKRGPKPTGKGTLVGVRLHDPELSALDSWRSEQDPEPTRPEAIRYALRDWLIGMGAIPLKKTDT